MSGADEFPDKVLRLKGIPDEEIGAIMDEVANRVVITVRRMNAVNPHAMPFTKEELQAVRVGAMGAGPIFLVVMTEHGYVEEVDEPTAVPAEEGTPIHDTVYGSTEEPDMGGTR